MKRQFRILKHQEFDRIIHGGKALRTPHYSIYLEPNEGKARIGIAVSKKNGGAVTRVKIKRQVRAMIAAGFDLSTPVNLIIVVRPSYDTEAYSSESEELLSSLSHIKEPQN
jgi:ribonuclease P protein component